MKFIWSMAVFVCAISLTVFAQQPTLPPPPQVLNQVQTVEVLATPAPTPKAPSVGQNPETPPAPTPLPVQIVQPTTAPVFDSSQLPAGFPPPQLKDFPAKPKDEKFVPSEVIAALPPVAKAQEIRAVLRTSMGDITIKLDRTKAPLTVAQFIALARGEKEFTDVKTSKPVKRPFYNGLIFHRVVKGTLIQTGDPFGTGRGDAGTAAHPPDEMKPTMKFTKPGFVAMAPMRDVTGLNLVKNSNGSQFFITLKEMPEWNGQFTIFGEVEDGMDVVQKIGNAKVGPTDRPIKRVYLVAVEIIESN